MTVIAAITNGTRITMAADTTSNLGGCLIPGARKIRRCTSDNGEQLLIGVSGQAALTALISRMPVGNTPEPDASTDQLNAWAETAAEMISATAMDAKPPVVEDGHVGATILLGFRGHLWLLAQQTASLVADGSRIGRHWSIGSGSDVAKGYIDGAGGPYCDLTDETILSGAVMSACRYDDGCHLGPDTKPQIEVLG